MRQYLSNLASVMQGLAAVMADGEKVQKECPSHLKAALLEASHALDTQSVRIVYPPTGGPKVVNSRGASRLLTWRERVAILLLGGRTEIRT